LFLGRVIALVLDISTTAFWIALLKIVLIDILLGGDNAVVIALACRKLPRERRKQGIFWGVAGAIGLRVALISFAMQLLAIPWLKAIGGVLLLCIGVKLLLPESKVQGHIIAATTLSGAIKTIIAADVVMSLDNVVAVAGAANGNLPLVSLGILISIPIVVWGSQLVLKLMDRYPIVITAGGALLGWIGASMIVTDPALPATLLAGSAYANTLAAISGAALVVAIGKWLALRATPRAAVELTTNDPTKGSS
jgi:YjbE family integral membrane protein